MKGNDCQEADIINFKRNGVFQNKSREQPRPREPLSDIVYSSSGITDLLGEILRLEVLFLPLFHATNFEKLDCCPLPTFSPPSLPLMRLLKETYGSENYSTPSAGLNESQRTP